MEPVIDCLFSVVGWGKVDILLNLRNGQWVPPPKKSKTIQLPSPPNEAIDLFWGQHLPTRVTFVRPAVQAVDLNKPQKWSQLFSSPGCIIKAKQGPAVLVARQGDSERWFGVVTLAKQGTQADPGIVEDSTFEIEACKEPLIQVDNYVCVFPPQWEPQRKEGGIRLESNAEIRSFFEQLLHSEVVRKIDETADWVSGLRTRLGLTPATDESFLNTLAESLVTFPAFKEKFEKEKKRINLSATEEVDRLRHDRDRLKTEISDLRERKVKEIGAALEQLHEDDRILATVAALGLDRSRSSLDLSGVVSALQDISSRPSPPAVNHGGIISALGSIGDQVKDLALQCKTSVPDLDSILKAISAQNSADWERLSASNPRRDEHPQGAQQAIVLNKKIPTGATVANLEGLEDLGLDEVHKAQMIIAHAGLLPVVSGGRAPESIHALIGVIAADRSQWWHCPADATDATAILSSSQFSGLMSQALQHPDRLFALVLEGIDRAPTEAYLEPLLVKRSLQIPVDSSGNLWPSNLLLFSTMTCGGKTVLPIAPGIWQRAVPVSLSANVRRSKELSEITPEFWSGNSKDSALIDLTGLIPASVRPLNKRTISTSVSYLAGDVPEPLVKGIAVASCLAKGDGSRPIGDFRGFERLLD